MKKTDSGRRVLTATFLVRSPETGEIVKRQLDYSGSVPAKVWNCYQIEFLKFNAAKSFYPLDPFDAYQFGAAAIMNARERMERGELGTNGATPETYLVRVGRNALLTFIGRSVAPARASYRAVENRTIGRGAIGEDDFDADNQEGTTDSPSAGMAAACGEEVTAAIPAGAAFTAQLLAEAMPGRPSARERRDRAAFILEEVYTALSSNLGEKADIIISAYRAYVAEDGDIPRAAKKMKISPAWLYRRWPFWLKLTKKIVEKIGTLFV